LIVLIILISGIINVLYLKNNNDNMEDYEDDNIDEPVVLESEPYEPDSI